MNRKAGSISIVVPVYNEEGNIKVLYDALVENLAVLDVPEYEILFVSDGSTDQSESILGELARQDKHVKGLFFSRNHGHQFALKAGLDHSSGDVVISMDADLQHPPELIKELYVRWQEGYDVVQTIRKDTEGAGIFKKATASVFYKIMNWLSDVDVKSGAADFRLLDKKVVETLRQIRESSLFMRGLIPYLGYSTCYFEFSAPERFAGTSKYTLRKMIRFAVDGILGFSVKPLRIAAVLGLVMSFFAVLSLLYVLVSVFVLHNTVHGWASAVSIVALLGGIQLVSLGVIGEYVGRAFMELKGRPQYIIRERVNL